MDVSDREAPGGQELLETIVSLTGLPEEYEPLLHEELGQILQLTGQEEGTVTLDQLREAMLAYLESMQAEVAADDPSSQLPV